MYGYAIKKGDYYKEIILKVIDESSAGSPSKKKISTGQAVRTFTGGIIPLGANKVIIQENVKILNGNKIKITKLAQGLPIGGEIENLDDGTLISAFKNRSKLNINST